MFSRSSASESEQLTVAPSTSGAVSPSPTIVTATTTQELESVTSWSEHLSARRTAPSTGPLLCPETSSPFLSLEESCVTSPVQQPSDTSQEEKEALEGKVCALKNALDIKDTEMKVMKAAHKAQIENLKEKFAQSVPVLSVPMPSAPVVKSCDCSRKEEEYRVALESVVEETNKRFLAMYHHARNLAEEVTKQNLLISALQHSESIATTLVADQKVVVQSTLALVKKERRTKFTTAYTVSHSVTAPQPEVYEQISEASIRLLEEQRRFKREEVAQLAMKVDQLAKVYSPAKYDLPNPSNAEIPKVVDNPENLPDPVPAEMFAIWMTQAGEGEMTEVEQRRFNSFMNQQIRPPPIYSPDLVKPYVNWNKVNPFQERNLPKPAAFPLSGCSPDPTFYDKQMRVYLSGSDVSCPFGYRFGFSSNMGIVPVPVHSLHGYRCCNKSGTWQLDARG